MSKNNYLILESDKACQMPGSFLSDRFKTSVLFQGSAHFQHLDLVPNEGFQKSKNTNSVILHKVKSNQVSHGAWSVVDI